MEGDAHHVHPHLLDLPQQLRGEMQPRGGRGGRAVFPGIDRLIPLLVAELFLDIGGQGHGAQLLQQLKKNSIILEPDQAIAVGLDLLHHGGEPPVAKGDGRPLPQPAAGIDDAVPQITLHIFQQKDLHRGRAGPRFLAIEPGREHPGVVDDQAVSRPEMLWQIIKMLVPHRASASVQGHEPGMIPLQEGRLGDELLGKIVVKIRTFHGKTSPFCAKRRTFFVNRRYNTPPGLQ